MADTATAPTTYREHFEQTYASDEGTTYEAYRPAYVFGQQQALDAFLAGRTYAEAREHLLARYENQHDGEYEAVEAAVRFAYERTAGARTTSAGWIKDAREGAALAVEQTDIEAQQPHDGTAIRYDLYDDDFKLHLRRTIGGDVDYNDFRDAYYFGLTSARNSEYRQHPYVEVEDQLRKAFAKRFPNRSYDEVQQAIRYGFSPSVAGS